tara:strand:+ start:229 stop:1002 length:774 start_codon:yes stop_codon:yes gene_type:complete
MENIILFVKSYRGDLQRCMELAKSIEKYNKDNIPFYISVPTEDIKLFKQNIPQCKNIIDDNTITDNSKGWIGQQFVKSLLYKLNLCKFYVCLDSDVYFFKDFYIKDFLYTKDIPYMVMHERDDFYEFVDRFPNVVPDGCREGHEREYRSIMSHFGREGKIYHYGISPYIWDTKVWEWLDTEWGLDTLFAKHANELKWYGEGALAIGTPMMPTSPLFKEFHFPGQYQLYKQLGWEEEHFHKQYMGMVMQSNWGAPLKY